MTNIGSKSQTLPKSLPKGDPPFYRSPAWQKIAGVTRQRSFNEGGKFTNSNYMNQMSNHQYYLQKPHSYEQGNIPQRNSQQGYQQGTYFSLCYNYRPDSMTQQQQQPQRQSQLQMQLPQQQQQQQQQQFQQQQQQQQQFQQQQFHQQQTHLQQQQQPQPLQEVYGLPQNTFNPDIAIPQYPQYQAEFYGNGKMEMGAQSAEINKFEMQNKPYYQQFGMFPDGTMNYQCFQPPKEQTTYSVWGQCYPNQKKSSNEQKKKTTESKSESKETWNNFYGSVPICQTCTNKVQKHLKPNATIEDVKKMLLSGNPPHTRRQRSLSPTGRPKKRFATTLDDMN